MNLKTFKAVLETLDSVTVNAAILEPSDDGGTLIRGASQDQNIIVYHTIKESLTDTPMGIQSVKGLLSRINLFDVEKAALELSVGERRKEPYVNLTTIKEGRRKVSFRNGDLKAMKKLVPGFILSSGGETLSISSDYVTYLSTAITSMTYTGDKTRRTLSMSVEDHVMKVNIFDGEDDSFGDEQECDEIESLPNGTWEVAPFQRVMKKSVESDPDNVARMTINEYRVAVFTVGPIEVMVCPMA